MRKIPPLSLIPRERIDQLGISDTPSQISENILKIIKSSDSSLDKISKIQFLISRYGHDILNHKMLKITKVLKIIKNTSPLYESLKIKDYELLFFLIEKQAIPHCEISFKEKISTEKLEEKLIEKSSKILKSDKSDILKSNIIKFIFKSIESIRLLELIKLNCDLDDKSLLNFAISNNIFSELISNELLQNFISNSRFDLLDFSIENSIINDDLFKFRFNLNYNSYGNYLDYAYKYSHIDKKLDNGKFLIKIGFDHLYYFGLGGYYNDLNLIKFSIENNKSNFLKSFIINGITYNFIEIFNLDFNNKQNALIYALNTNQDSVDLILKILEEFKLNPNVKNFIDQQDKYGQTALIHAIKLNNRSAIESLIQLECNCEIKDLSGLNAQKLCENLDSSYHDIKEFYNKCLTKKTPLAEFSSAIQPKILTKANFESKLYGI